jgi:hypothetical protein
MEPAHEARWAEALFDTLSLIVDKGYLSIRKDCL